MRFSFQLTSFISVCCVSFNTPYKNFELMLTRRAKAYSSSCSQIALVYLQPFHRNSLLKSAAQPKIAKKQ